VSATSNNVVSQGERKPSLDERLSSRRRAKLTAAIVAAVHAHAQTMAAIAVHQSAAAIIAKHMTIG